jgi:hypothetical protein
MAAFASSKGLRSRRQRTQLNHRRVVNRAAMFQIVEALVSTLSKLLDDHGSKVVIGVLVIVERGLSKLLEPDVVFAARLTRPNRQPLERGRLEASRRW